MSNWIVCLPREDISHCLKISIFGLSRSHTISKVRDGDNVAFVVTKEKPWKLVALGKATGDYYVDDSQVFKKTGTFPDRFRFNAQGFQTEPDFQSLVPELDVVTQPQYWPVYFKMGILEVSDADWHKLSALAANHS